MYCMVEDFLEHDRLVFGFMAPLAVFPSICSLMTIFLKSFSNWVFLLCGNHHGLVIKQLFFHNSSPKDYNWHLVLVHAESGHSNQSPFCPCQDDGMNSIQLPFKRPPKGAVIASAMITMYPTKEHTGRGMEYKTQSSATAWAVWSFYTVALRSDLKL